ncbi:MAG: winged helix-turn-helix domain-containing protein [Idiomarina sp.]|nr:winged helix-turn-helix domain-containing protein [Idiomarina sp.]
MRTNKLANFQFAGIRYCPNTLEICAPNGNRIAVEPRIGRMIELFCEHPGELLSKDRIIAAIWAPKVVSEDSLTVAISRLRRTLKQCCEEELIKTVAGRGYIWLPPTEIISANEQPKPRKPMVSAATLFIGSVLVALVATTIWFISASAPDSISVNTSSETKATLAANDTDIAYYRQQLSDRPDALAYVGLARAKINRITVAELPVHSEELVALLQRALELDAHVAEAQWLLAKVQFYGEWDFPSARETWQREYAAGNREPEFLLEFAEAMLAMREFEWVQQAMANLRQRNPEFYATPMVAWLHIMMGENEAARQEIERIIASEPATYGAHISAHHIGYLTGDENMAWQHMHSLMELTDITNAMLTVFAERFAQGGMQAVHQELLHNQQWTAFGAGNPIGHYQGSLAQARHAVGAGYYEQALEYIQQALAERDMSLLWLLADPYYAPLHELPEFQPVREAFMKITGQPFLS